jgi:hypothetical protein
MKPPLERFLDQALKEFEDHLRNEGITGAREQRMRGAREFAVFLLSRPQKKGEVTKGKIG